MSEALPLSTTFSAPRPALRVASVDIFRGLTMMVMIFVNELGEVKGLPAWTYHMPGKVDAMSYVDMVFPIFLFIMGLSLPLAIQQRLKKNASVASLWVHILLRSFALVVIGEILANAEKGNEAMMHLSRSAWGLIALSGAVLFWAVYPRKSWHPMAVHTLRFIGFAAMAVMFTIFRRTGKDGLTHWIDFSYPEILGLIGYNYFAVCLLHIPTRRILWAPIAWTVTMIALCSAITMHWLPLLRHAPLYFWPFGNGSHAALTMAGIATSNLFLESHRWSNVRSKVVAALGFAAVVLLSGFLLTPLGISKIRATPTWTLYCIGAGILIFAMLYWLCDIKGRTSWAFFVRSAGSNTLLTYMLPDFFYFITGLIGFHWLGQHWNVGASGVWKSVIFTLVILAISALLTRCKVRLQI